MTNLAAHTPGDSLWYVIHMVEAKGNGRCNYPRITLVETSIAEAEFCEDVKKGKVVKHGRARNSNRYPAILLYYIAVVNVRHAMENKRHLIQTALVNPLQRTKALYVNHNVI